MDEINMFKSKVLYMMSWAVTDSVGTQLWIDRTCRVNLNYSGSYQTVNCSQENHLMQSF